jgi:putative endonuclease
MVRFFDSEAVVLRSLGIAGQNFVIINSMFYVYILKSLVDESLYIGSTEDLKKRVNEHNSGNAKYSKTKRPYKLIWYCVFSDKTRALIFEKYLKHGSGHAFTKKHLI